MTPDKNTLAACSQLLNQHWPELTSMPRPVAVLALNRIQQVLETEGLAAITPERIEGWKELTEGYLMPTFEHATTTAVAQQSPKPSASDSAGN